MFRHFYRVIYLHVDSKEQRSVFASADSFCAGYKYDIERKGGKELRTIFAHLLYPPKCVYTVHILKAVSFTTETGIKTFSRTDPPLAIGSGHMCVFGREEGNEKNKNTVGIKFVERREHEFLSR